jgi:lysophospholipase L1-like esterase
MVAMLICGTATEALLRFGFGHRLYVHVDERNSLFDYHERLGWFPKPRSSGFVTGCRRVSVHHNSRGFRDTERERGPARIAVLGDSFVWGFDVEAPERFTERLEGRLTGWAVHNLGVSGYGTDQQYLLLQDQWADLEPNIVVVIVSENDALDNSTNVRYHGYFKPYFVEEGGVIRLRGVPVPRSENYFYAAHPWLARAFVLRALVAIVAGALAPQAVAAPDPTEQILLAMRQFVEARGATFVVAFQRSQEVLAARLSAEGHLTVNLDNPHRYPNFGEHWTPEGHEVASSRLYEALARSGALDHPKLELTVLTRNRLPLRPTVAPAAR